MTIGLQTPPTKRNPKHEERQDLRLPVQMPVHICAPSGQWRVLTENISGEGMFVRTDMYFRLGQRLHLEIALPDRDRLLEVEAVVAHVLVPVGPERKRGRLSGAGLRFEWQEPRARKLWASFVGSLLPACRGRSPERPLQLVQAGDRVINAARRLYPRVQTRIPVLLEANEGRLETRSYDISVGGAFLFMDSPLPVGSAVQLTLLDPMDSESFQTSAVVVRAGRTKTGELGVGVAFDKMPEETISLLKGFVDRARWSLESV